MGLVCKSTGSTSSSNDPAMRTHAKRTRTETPPTLFKRRLNANVINEHPWILPYDHKRNVTTIVIRTLEDGRLGQSPPKPEAGTTVRASDEKATCMRWYHKPSGEPESKETRTHACKQNINKNLFLFFTSSFLACSHTVIIFYHGQSACRHRSSAFHLRRIREPVYAKRTLLERTTSHAHSTLFCRLLFEIQLESFS